MKNPEDFLPLGQSTLYILMSLRDGAKHGYAIAKDVEETSEGEVRIAIGNLYVSLQWLLKQGLIERETGEAAGGERNRKTYRLTGLGERVLSAEITRMRRVVQTASRRLGSQPILSALGRGVAS